MGDGSGGGRGKVQSPILDFPLSPTIQLWGAVSFKGREVREKIQAVKPIRMQS